MLNPHHLFVAYIYDQPQQHPADIVTFIEQAQALDYPLRYWWLSEAIKIEDAPDRLILAVNTRSQGQEAGLDLYQALEAEAIFWDEHEAASYAEYDKLGKQLSELDDIQTPTGELLFEQPLIPLLQLDPAELQDIAYQLLGRPLRQSEVEAVSEALKRHLKAQIEWEATLRDSLIFAHELGFLEEGTDKASEDILDKRNTLPQPAHTKPRLAR